MFVDTATSTHSAHAAQSAGPGLDYQMFLKLLVAEMKNQDPTNPMDSTQYVAQLAAFSQVEQSIQTNKKLDNLLQASTLSQATGLIGKEITSFDGEISGTVKEVKIYTDGIVAVLEDGRQVAVTAGVAIRDAALAEGGAGEGEGGEEEGAA